MKRPVKREKSLTVCLDSNIDILKLGEVQNRLKSLYVENFNEFQLDI